MAATDTLPRTTTAKPTSSASAPASPNDDPFTYYTWSTFFAALSGQASPHERAQYFRARDIANEESDVKRISSHVDYLYTYSPLIRFMREEIQKLGHDVPPSVVRCRRCEGSSAGGGFNPDHGILLCSNYMKSRGHVEDTLAHEMVHVYDHLRWKFDKLDLRHAACTEVTHFLLSRLS
ncbi:hypothetical protein LTS18_013090 [Coniosporium uncinatum]|uniref:Uncharacterized protein n=1 Tax=Coniosporium uncinatum TaxID=93489 RepID=A0ACC3DZA4_9PEZI|nr:hypothetical protein LTS18_013090 [Coniosporium uncinatum]